MRIRAYARMFLAMFKANLSAVAEYRLNFAIQVLGMMLNNGAFIVFWGVLFDKAGSLSGYVFDDVMFIWALVSAAFGIAHVICGNARFLGSMIRNGDLDVYLLQPKNVFLNVLCSRMKVSAWGDLFYGFIVLAFLPGTDLGRYALFLILAISGAAIFVATFAAMESLSFFLGSTEGFAAAMTEFLISFSLYPESVFPSGMRWIFYSLVPSGFIAFVPLWLYKNMDWPMVPALLAVAALYCAASYALFRAGLSRYESGNRIGTRL